MDGKTTISSRDRHSNFMLPFSLFVSYKVPYDFHASATGKEKQQTKLYPHVRARG